MWFLAKCAFWLTLVVALLPVGEADRRAGVHYVSTGEAVSALTVALTDARGFCTRNPEACATGANAVQGLGHKAQIGARMLHDFISERLADSRDLTPPAGSAQRADVSERDTLGARDREPNWRGPEPRRI